MPQAIFFDLDETLIRHTTPVMEQLQLVCHRHLAGLSEQRWQTFQRHLMTDVGEVWNNIGAYSGRCEAEFASIFRRCLERVDADVTLDMPMIEDFIASVVESTGPSEDAFVMLDRLADAGIVTGIITNGFSFLQKRKVKAHGLAERVRVVMTSEDAGAHKPDIRIFQRAMAPLGVVAADSWHVGDNLDKDIAGAHGAGLQGVLYDPDGFLADPSSPHIPDRVIARLLEIAELVEKDRRT